MKRTRREFLLETAAAATGALFAGSALGTEGAPRPFHPLRRDVGVFVGRGGTIGWLARADALVVVDSQFPQTARPCLEAVTTRAGRPRLDALINTHHHQDHVAGNGVFRPVTERIIAHENVPKLQERQAATLDPPREQVYADTTFSTSFRLDAGGETIALAHHGPAHTGGDAVVRFEAADVVHLGDLVFNRWYPFIDRPGGASIRGWIKVLDTVIAGAGKGTLFVFGHGKPEFGITGSVEDVRTQRNFLEALLEHARRARAAGRSLDEAAAVEHLPGFPDHVAVSERLSLRANLAVAWEELGD
ncbi:MAG: MBL fold metallo-hydrolase [Acidobacteria bacterium]|nr:MAG: MBL fold metallo-hydrolase [Acidobacteriota bacterium]